MVFDKVHKNWITEKMKKQNDEKPMKQPHELLALIAQLVEH